MSEWPALLFGEDPDKEIPYLTKLIFNEANAVAKDKGISVQISRAIIQEIYYSTTRTLKYLLMKPEQIDFYKPAGHLAFWISELKPITVIEPPAQRLAKLGGWMDEAIMGGQAKVIKVAEKRVKTSQEAREYFINEHVALTIASDIISATQTQRLLDDGFDEGDFNGERAGRQKFFIQQMERMRISLRYHNYSTRGMSTMLEMTLKTSRV